MAVDMVQPMSHESRGPRSQGSLSEMKSQYSQCSWFRGAQQWGFCSLLGVVAEHCLTLLETEFELTHTQPES